MSKKTSYIHKILGKKHYLTDKFRCLHNFCPYFSAALPGMNDHSSSFVGLCRQMVKIFNLLCNEQVINIKKAALVLYFTKLNVHKSKSP